MHVVGGVSPVAPAVALRAFASPCALHPALLRALHDLRPSPLQPPGSHLPSAVRPRAAGILGGARAVGLAPRLSLAILGLTATVGPASPGRALHSEPWRSSAIRRRKCWRRRCRRRGRRGRWRYAADQRHVVLLPTRRCMRLSGHARCRTARSQNWARLPVERISPASLLRRCRSSCELVGEQARARRRLRSQTSSNSTMPPGQLAAPQPPAVSGKRALTSRNSH